METRSLVEKRREERFVVGVEGDLPPTKAFQPEMEWNFKTTHQEVHRPGSHRENEIPKVPRKTFHGRKKDSKVPMIILDSLY